MLFSKNYDWKLKFYQIFTFTLATSGESTAMKDRYEHHREHECLGSHVN